MIDTSRADLSGAVLAGGHGASAQVMPQAVARPGGWARAGGRPMLRRPSATAWLLAASLPVLVFLLVPILIVVPMAFTRGQILTFPPQLFSVRPFTDLFADQSWMVSAWLSLKTGVLATLIATVCGVSAALGLGRSAPLVKGMLTAVVLLPIMIPGIVMALGFYLFFRQVGVSGSWVSIAVAHSVIITPYVFVATQASLSGVDRSLPRAARSLGAGSLTVFRAVYWPAIRPGVIGGAVFAFIGSFDEVVISMFLAGPGVVTMPVQMFTSLQTDLTPKVAAVSAMLFLLSVVGLLAQGYQYKNSTNGKKSRRAP